MKNTKNMNVNKYTDLEIMEILDRYTSDNTSYRKGLSQYAFFNEVVTTIENATNSLSKNEIQEVVSRLVFPTHDDLKDNGVWRLEDDGIEFHFWSSVIGSNLLEIELRVIGEWETDFKSAFANKRDDLQYILDNTFPKGANTSKWENMEHIIDNDRLVLCVSSKKDNLNFNNLDDNFPSDIKTVTVGIKWNSNPTFWHEERFDLTHFWSTIMGRYLKYPKTYKDLFATIEMIIAEHFKFGTVGINDNGDFCTVAYQGMGKMYGLVGDILNCEYTEKRKLPVFIKKKGYKNV